MRKTFVTVLVASLFAIGSAAAWADSTGTAGQPSQTCLTPETGFTEPGNAATAPGSAFNESRPGTAGTVYAGNGANTNTPANDHAVSQYDVACYQVSHH